MKRNIYISIMCFLMAITGCTNEYLLDESTASESFVLKVQVENAGGSRTMIDDANNVLWTEGDVIGVFMEGSEQSVPFKFAGMTENIANFSSDIAPGKVIAAYYPYNETATLEGSKLSLFLPLDHNYMEGHTNGEMLGLPIGENRLYFKHLCGMLKVTVNDIPAGAAKLKVRGTTWPNPTFHGDFIVNDINAEEPVLTDNDFECQDVNFNFSEDYTGMTKTFYVPLPAGNHPIEVSLRDANDKYLWYKMATINIKRASIVELPYVETTKAYAYITSHENGYTFSGHRTYTTMTVSGIIKNFNNVNDVKINLKSTLNGRHAEYHIYGYAAYPQGKEKSFEQELDIYPGENVFTISWSGKDTGYNEVKGDTTFVINYNETPVIAEAVDMGLSVKWAKHNLGAENETDYGCLYMWGDPTGTDLNHEDDIYDDFKEQTETIINFCGDPKYDVVTNKWGGDWRLPSEEDFSELLEDEKISAEFCTLDGVNGIRFKNIITGNNIFFPASGYYYGYHDLRERNTLGLYMIGVEYYDNTGHNYFNNFSYLFDTNNKDSYGYLHSNYYTLAPAVRPVKDN